MKKEKKRMTIMKKMAIAVIGGLVVGISFLLLKNALGGDSAVWNTIDRLLFKDISTEEGFHSIGIFYIIGQLFMNGLQLAIVPLVLASLCLAICSISEPGKLGKIASKTIICFIVFYIIGATLSGAVSYFVMKNGFFSVTLPEVSVENVATMEQYNPLTVIINAVPNNIISALSSNNSILAVVVVAVILGICMHKLPQKTEPLKKVFEGLNNIIQLYLEFIINKISPIAIFCMISRTFATYGIEYLKPMAAFVVTGVVMGIVLVLTIYPIGIFLTTRLNPFKFLKKTIKVALFAAATNSSAATLPLNTKTCTEELGCSKEISSFVLPTGMTINMNGTTVMHMIAVTFIASTAGIEITPIQLVIVALLSISTAMGCPAVPVAGTTLVYVLLAGMGFTSDACMIGYALVVAMNYPVGMSVITMNVVGDAATNVIVSSKEGELNKEIYNS